MWSFVLVCLMISWAEAQNGRGPQLDHSGHGWDIRLAVPGQPGNDYPTLGNIPRTGFSCAGRKPGYYADLETNCQVFRVCTVGSTYGFQSFLCPNGTLFNQEVFVCDWWMNVNCQNSEQLFTNNNQQFENLRLGPQLMKDIKKMLTHPMRNPYDRNMMKNSRIVMQEYKPPSGQLFPNGALLAGPERQPNNVYVPAKQIQQNFEQRNTYSNQFNAYPSSTPDTRYIPSAFNTNRPQSQRDVEIFQRQQQRQNGQYKNKDQSHNLKPGNLISNGHAAQYTQTKNSVISDYDGYKQIPRPTPSYKQDNIQHFTQNQHIKDTQTNVQYTNNAQRGESQKVQQSDTTPPPLKNVKQAELSSSFTKQQYNTNVAQQTYTVPSPIPQYTNEEPGNEFKQNLVSTILQEAPTTIVTKSLTYSRIIQEPKPNKPKSRITIKTWIVKPSSKGEKLIAQPTSYIYNMPTQSPQKLVDDPSPYIYNRPTSIIQSEKEISDVEKPYVYNRPTAPPTKLPKLVDSTTPYIMYNNPTVTITTENDVSESDQPQPYVYNRPTVVRQIIATTSESSRFYLPPTPMPRPRPFSGRLTAKPSSILPTKASRIYLPPTTSKPAEKLFVPPSENTIVLSRQYLSPDFIQRPDNYQSSQLRATPTTPSFIPSSDNYKPELTVVKHSYVNANHKNASFADILTKEKLDITVNDIVKDTDNILKTASPEPFGQLKQDFRYVDYPEDNYLSTQAGTDSGKNLTSQTPAVATKSSKIIAQPVTHLEAPVETNFNPNANRLSNLPYLKEPTNIIERTVSLKISIPEKVAAYLFKCQNDTEFDSLEILNTGSSNYLVLTNPLLNKSSKANFIPLGKLVGNKNKNISNSQALVYSFLADSLNVAKEYSSLAQQDITSPSFQNLNNEELARITNDVSQLTSSQYSDLNTYNNNAANSITSTQTSTAQTNNQILGNNQYTSQQNLIQPAQYITAPAEQTQKPAVTSQSQSNDVSTNILGNNQLYSGQLYQVSVPEVTDQIYNRPSTTNLAQASNLQSNTLTPNVQNTISNFKHSNADIEIVRSKTVPLGSAMVHVQPNESDSFNSQETLTNLLYSDNGISAQLQDNIVGTIQHPLEENKLLTYKKDRSYYLFSKFDNADNVIENNNVQRTNMDQPNTNLIKNDVFKNIAFQLIPSVSYQVEGEKEQDNFLSSFRIDEFGAPREVAKTEQTGKQGDRVLTSSTDFTVEHPTSANLVASQANKVNAIYAGPSSYSAPQASVGNLKSKQVTQSNFKSNLEQFNENQSNGYDTARPARRFSF